MDCDKIRRDLAAFIDGELEDGEVADIEKHLTGCEACREGLDELRRTARALEELLEPMALSESVQDGVLAALASERAKPRVPLLVRVSWLLTGAVAAVLILAVFGFLGSGRGAIADEIIDEALADHTQTLELFKKQVVSSAVRDPLTGVKLIRVELRLSGLKEKTSRLVELLSCSDHSRKAQIEEYISSVHNFIDFVEDPPVNDPAVIREAVRKNAMDVSPIAGVLMIRASSPVQIDVEVPGDLSEKEKSFIMAKRELYKGDYGSAAHAFAIAARQASGSPLAEDAKYWQVYAELQGSGGQIEIKGDIVVPTHDALRREMGKDFMKWVEKMPRHGHRDPQKFREMFETLGRKVGVGIETTMDEQGNTVIKVERKDSRGNSATSVLKFRSTVEGEKK